MAPSGPFRQTFNPFLCPIAAHAKILHFNGEFKPWMLSGPDTESWRLLGLNVSANNGGMPREIIGRCQIDACPTSVNITTGRRLRSACETWFPVSSSGLYFNGAAAGANNATARPAPKGRWDQQHYSPKGEPWSKHGKPESVTEYYASGCIARPPLCTCSSVLSDDCLTICASHWHEFVGQDVMQDAAARGAPPSDLGGYPARFRVLSSPRHRRPRHLDRR